MSSVGLGEKLRRDTKFEIKRIKGDRLFLEEGAGIRLRSGQ